MSKTNFVNQGHIGTVFGVSSHRIGKWLVECGLRTEDKRPTSLAFDGNYVLTAPLDHGGYHWTWHKDKTITALCKAGKKTLSFQNAEKLAAMLKDEDQPVIGPFKKRQDSPNLFELVDSNGSVATWATGDKHSDAVLKVLNLAYRCGHFGGSKS